MREPLATEINNRGDVKSQTVINIANMAGNIFTPAPSINRPTVAVVPLGNGNGTIVENDEALKLVLSGKTLSKLCDIINEIGWGYRSGAKLVSFFNDLGFSHDYPDSVAFWERFPSRAEYTTKMLKEINGTPKLKECIKNAFAIGDFVERLPELDELIYTFNLYMTLDNWSIARDNSRIVFVNLSEETSAEGNTDTSAINRDYYNLIVTTADIVNCKTTIMESRVLKDDTELVKRLASFDKEACAQLKTFPALIMNENTLYSGNTDAEQMAYFGFITDIKVLQIGKIKIKFRCVAKIPQQAINSCADNLDIFGGTGITELNHTHWTIKNVDLIEELTDAGLLSFDSGINAVSDTCILTSDSIGGF